MLQKHDTNFGDLTSTVTLVVILMLKQTGPGFVLHTFCRQHNCGAEIIECNKWKFHNTSVLAALEVLIYKVITIKIFLPMKKTEDQWSCKRSPET